jgi:hypothetical protein
MSLRAKRSNLTASLRTQRHHNVILTLNGVKGKNLAPTLRSSDIINVILSGAKNLAATLRSSSHHNVIASEAKQSHRILRSSSYQNVIASEAKQSHRIPSYQRARGDCFVIRQRRTPRNDIKRLSFQATVGWVK